MAKEIIPFLCTSTHISRFSGRKRLHWLLHRPPALCVPRCRSRVPTAQNHDLEILRPAPAPFSTTSRWPQQPPGTRKGAQVVARQSELPGWNGLQKFKAWSSPALPRVNTNRAFICRAGVVRQSGANTWLNNTQHREAHYVEGNGGRPVVVSAVWLHFKEPVEEEGLEKVFSYLKNDQTLITSSQLEQ